MHTLVGQRRIGVDHLQYGGFASTERKGEIGLVLADADPVEGPHDALDPGVVGDPHGHQIARLLQAPAQRVGAAGTAHVKVLEAFLAQVRALIDAKRTVQDHAGRCHSVIETGGINEGLDRRARLTQRLRRPVERTEAGIEAALHRQHPAGIRAFDHHAAGNLGDRAHGVGGPGGRGGNDVACAQTIGQTRQRRARSV